MFQYNQMMLTSLLIIYPIFSALCIVFIFYKLDKSKFAIHGVAPSYISSLALTFGLFASLTAGDVWKRIDQENAFITAEASSLRTILKISDYLFTNAEKSDEAREYVNDYIINEQRLLTATRNTGEIYTAPSQPLAKLSELYKSESFTNDLLIRETYLKTLIELRSARFQRLEAAKSHLSIYKLLGIAIFGTLTQIAIVLSHAGNFRAQFASVFLFSGAFVAIMGLLTIFESNKVFASLVSFSPLLDSFM
jgi:hypothetical protein